MEKIKVHKALTCKEDDSVIVVSKLLKKEKERRIFVIDSKGMLKGIITTTDLVYQVLTTKKYDSKAKDIMTKKVECLEDSEPLEKALGVMNTVKSFVCPITHNGKFLGIMHHHDIMKFLASSKK